VFNGDVCQPGLLKGVGATDAEVIIVTLNDAASTKKAVASLRELYPDTSIYARGHDLDVCQKLSHLGASGVVSENVEASLELARMTMTRIGVDEMEKEDLLLKFEQKYKADIKIVGG